MDDQRGPQPRSLPTVVLGGWLGAGKTTLINDWLRHADGLRLAVLVNDFGEISIDADLIVGADGDVISLAGGCICCAVGSDLFGALRRMTAREPRPDLLLLETSGVALPAAVARTVRLVPDIEVHAVVVLVDGQAWYTHLDDRYVGDTVRQQVAEADVLVLTKLDAPRDASEVSWASRPDAAEAVRLRAALATIAPGTIVLDARVDALGLLRAVLDPGGSPQASSLQRRTAEPARPDPSYASAPRVGLGPGRSPTEAGEAGAARPRVQSTAQAIDPDLARVLRARSGALAPANSRFESITEHFQTPVDPRALLDRWTAAGSGVLRAKGWVTGLDGRRWRIQIVGRRADVSVDDRAPSEDRVVVIRVKDEQSPP